MAALMVHEFVIVECTNMAPVRLGLGLVVVMQWAVTAELPARGVSLRARSCVAVRGAAARQRHEGRMHMLHAGEGGAPVPTVLRLRGGAKSISTKPRTWKQQSKHHAEMRKSSIRKKRGKNPQEATWTQEARANIRTVADARRLREMAENEERKLRLKEERGTDFNHQLRLEYLQANEEADRRREERYQTLEDISDSVEREIEQLRQKRGESRGLTVPDWRGEHPSYWKEVEQEVANEREDLSNPEKVWKEATEEGNVWKVAALNRYQDGKQQRAPPRLALTLDASGGSIVSGDGGGGGMQLAERQAANLDPGPMQFEEASSSYEREEEEKAKSSAAREAEQSRKRKAERKNKIRKLREAARQREESERAKVRQERELA